MSSFVNRTDRNIYKAKRGYSKIREFFQPSERKIEDPINTKLFSALSLIYKCLLCGDDSHKELHPSKFLKKCSSCKNPAHLAQIKCSFGMIYGIYHCQSQKCNFKWVVMLPFKSIILSTPNCKRCTRRKKIHTIIYRNVKISFKHHLLFKCEKCSYSRSLTFPITSNKELNLDENGIIKHPICGDCKSSMTYVKNSRSISSKIIKKGNQHPDPSQNNKRVIQRNPVKKSNAQKFKQTRGKLMSIWAKALKDKITLSN